MVLPFLHMYHVSCTFCICSYYFQTVVLFWLCLRFTICLKSVQEERACFMYCFPQPTAVLICLKLWILWPLKQNFCLFYLRLSHVIILYTNCLASNISFFSHLFHMFLWQNSLRQLNFGWFHYCCFFPP